MTPFGALRPDGFPSPSTGVVPRTPAVHHGVRHRMDSPIDATVPQLKTIAFSPQIETGTTL